MKRAIKRITAIIIICVTLGGCSLMGGVETFLRAPSPNNMQEGLSLAIFQTVGTGIKYVTPLTGSYKKSFILNDLDNDGAQEAIIFYLNTEDTNALNYATAAIYTPAEEGQWRLIKTIQGAGAQIDYIEFRDFTGDSRKDILIGWIQNEEAKELCAYDIYSQSDEPIFFDKYNESRLFYSGSSFFILNLHRDIATGKGTAKISAISGNILRTVAFCEIYGGYDSIASIVYNKIRPEKKAILIDAKLGNSMITQILQWEDGNLTNLYYTEQAGVHPTLIRETSFTCSDIDGDGLTEVPISTPLPSVTAASGNKDVATAVVTGWAKVNLPENSTTTILDRKFFCIMNPALNYYYTVPSEWIGRFSCTYNTSDMSLTFYYFENDEFTKMFSLHGLTPDQYNARKEHGNWLELRKSTGRIYAMNVSGPKDASISTFMGNMAQNRERLVFIQ